MRLLLFIKVWLLILSLSGWIVPVQHIAANGGKGNFRVGLSRLVNVETGFGHLDRNTSITDPGFQNTDQGVNRFYDDGYVGVDATGNDSGLTWNWGVHSNAPTLSNGSMAFHKNAFSSDGNSVDGSPNSMGANITWVSNPRSLSKLGNWSLLANLDFIRLNSERNTTSPASLTQIQDLYSHSNFDPSLVSYPHQGTVEGPGPLLSDLPARTQTTVPDGGELVSRMNLEGRFVMLGLGGEYQHEIKENLSLLLQIRYMFGWFHGDFEYQDHFRLNDSDYDSEAGDLDISETLQGGAIGLGMLYRHDEVSSIFFSANKVFFDEIKGGVDQRSYYLDLASGVVISIGYQGLF